MAEVYNLGWFCTPCVEISLHWAMLFCLRIVPDTEMLNSSLQYILEAQPTWNILITIAVISFTKCSRFVQTSGKLDPFWTCINAEKHSFFQHSQFLGTILADFFFQGCFFSPNSMLFIKKKKTKKKHFRNVSISETQKISAKNTQ